MAGRTAVTRGAALGAAVVALAAAGCSSGGARTTASTRAPARATETAATDTATGPTIRVAGHGKVEGTPNVMTVTMGVQTTDPSAQAALQRDNDRAAALVGALRSHGVAAKDIQTVDLQVSPVFDKNFRVTGYSASNTVTAELRDLARAGEVIDAAALIAGPDVRLQGVQFSIDDTSALVAQARAAAVRDALAQGHQLAAAAGVQLGPIRTIDDTGTELPNPVFQSNLGAAAGVPAPSVPIEPGSQELSVDVVVVFDLAS